ncbi:hypothetical protein JYK21_09155 [Ralstonia pickettii]|nr:hypothetical protein [Ralstonia pickettii]
MGWKSIELQVALPRTQDAGKIQEQLQKQPEVLQGTLTQSQLEREKIKRSRVNQLEKSEKVKLKKTKVTDDSSKTEEEIGTVEEIVHPYLGKSIDLNG